MQLLLSCYNNKILNKKNCHEFGSISAGEQYAYDPFVFLTLRSNIDIENQPYLQNAETFLEFLIPVTLLHVNELLLFYKKTK